MIQQQPHIYLFFLLLLVEALLVVLDIPSQTELQVGFGLPSHIPAYSDNVPTVLFSGLSPFFTSQKFLSSV